MVLIFLFYLFIFGWAVWHVGSQFPDQGSNLCHLHQKHGFMTTGPTEKSPDNGFKHLKNLFHIFMFSQQKTKRHILLDFIKPNFWFRKYHQQACFRDYFIQFSSVTWSCATLCDLMDCSIPGFPVHHQLLELTQIHVHRVMSHES